MRTDEFLDRLERVRQTAPSRWDACCPSHEDRNASLSVHENAEGWTILKCHVGCSSDDIVAAMRLTLADLFPERLAGERREHRAPRPEPEPEPFLLTEDDVEGWADRLARHTAMLAWLWEHKGWTSDALVGEYVGYDGERLTLPVRDAGGFLRGLVRYAPGGKPKTMAVKGTPRDLWPAPETIAGPLLLVEGEPDVISAVSLGINAVALPGAATWRDEWAQRLAGRRIVVMTDCDGPGRAAAARAVERLAPVAWVRSVDLAPQRDDGFDLGDLLLAQREKGGLDVLSRRLKALLET